MSPSAGGRFCSDMCDSDTPHEISAKDGGLMGALWLMIPNGVAVCVEFLMQRGPVQICYRTSPPQRRRMPESVYIHHYHPEKPKTYALHIWILSSSFYPPRITVSIMSTNLGAATQDRKARLAQLKSKSLKRKELEPSDDGNSIPSPQDREASEDVDIAKTILSGRNYDPETRGPKLGFEYAPNADKKTLEQEAAALEEATRQATLEDRTDDDGKPLEMDIFKLQPKKPNWDLKRDLKERTQILEVRKNNAIARLVRAKFEAKKKESAENGEAAGIAGKDLVDTVHMMEREEEEEAQREKEQDREMMETA